MGSIPFRPTGLESCIFKRKTDKNHERSENFESFPAQKPSPQKSPFDALYACLCGYVPVFRDARNHWNFNLSQQSKRFPNFSRTLIFWLRRQDLLFMKPCCTNGSSVFGPIHPLIFPHFFMFVQFLATLYGSSCFIALDPLNYIKIPILFTSLLAHLGL